ncbi:MAG: DUF4405 domain-containing protein [Hyphomicrobium sp.]|uniref:DUF4405 domain-containing protein n=1 Tax=Hyphomicrobium sp. TaxID=82 RepID=UPI0039E27EC4
MKTFREWATPFTIGAFAFMSITGVLMFFRLDSGLNKLGHEWLGWAFIMGVALHVLVNWKPFTRYFLSSGIARAVIGAFVIVLAGSFFSLSGSRGEGGPPPMLAMKAISRAPISNVAILAGRPAAEILGELRNAGITLPTENASIDSVTRGDRDLESKAMKVLFER